MRLLYLYSLRAVLAPAEKQHSFSATPNNFLFKKFQLYTFLTHKEHLFPHPILPIYSKQTSTLPAPPSQQQQHHHHHLKFHLKLPPPQIPHHLPPRNHRRPPQRPKIQRTTKRIRIPKSHHRRNPTSRILERKTRTFHFVLFDLPSSQMMYTSRRVDFWFVGVCGRVVGQLSACENVEVVVCCVSAGVAFGSDGCAEDDEVFGYACGWGGLVRGE